MATGFLNWSKVSANNTTADANINWQEGQAPSTVNDSGRGMMAALAQFRDDQCGTLQTAGGPTAFTVTSNQGYANPTPQNQSIRVNFNVANAINPTLAVDGGTAFPIQNPQGSGLPAAFLVAGTPYDLTFSTNAWILNHVVNAPIAPNTITRAMLQDGIINGGTGAGVKLDVNTITANNIANTTITGAKIANATITGTQIAATTIAAANIVNNTITAAQIANATITATQIANATITTTQISGAAGITGGQIASNTVARSNMLTDGASKGFVIGYDVGSGVVTTFPRAFEAQLLHVREEQPSGNNGTSAITSSVFNKRTLNIAKTSEISGASLNAGTSQITLPAGTYFCEGMCEGESSGFTNVWTIKARLRDVTNSVTLVVGTNDRASVIATGADASNNSVHVKSFLAGRFTLAGAVTIEFQAWMTSMTTAGTAVSSGEVEIYSDLMIWKVG